MPAALTTSPSADRTSAAGRAGARRRLRGDIDPDALGRVRGWSWWRTQVATDTIDHSTGINELAAVGTRVAAASRCAASTRANAEEAAQPPKKCWQPSGSRSSRRRNACYYRDHQRGHMKRIRLAHSGRGGAQAAAGAYCPTSRFRVGRRAPDGRRTHHTGCNIENASYGAHYLRPSASPLAAALAAGVRNFMALVIAAWERTPAPPCGICREMLAEFAAPEFPIRSVTLTPGDAPAAEYTLGELLPHAFELRE